MMKKDKIKSSDEPKIEKEENVKTGADIKKIKKKQNKQIMTAIILMVLVVVIVLAVPYYMKNYVYNFTYNKLDYIKYKSGEVIFYGTSIPVIDPTGQKIIGTYTMDFRNDPRSLEDIPVIFSSGGNNLYFVVDKKVYLSVSPDMKKCAYNIIAIANLGNFLDGFGKFDVKGASSDKTDALNSNITYANCENDPNNTVILIKSGEKNKIEKTGKNCFELVYADCDSLRVTEKFQITILDAYMDQFKKK